MIDQLLHAAWTVAIIVPISWAVAGRVHDRDWQMFLGIALAGLALGLPRELWDQSPWGPQKGAAPPLTLEDYVAWLMDPGRLSKLIDLAGYSLGGLILTAFLGLLLLGVNTARGEP